MSRRSSFKFRLYVAGDTANTAEALSNLTKFCHTRLPDRHEIEIVDVLKQPERALADAIFMTPTLLILAPPPVRRIVGTLTDNYPLLQLLKVNGVAA